MTDPPQQRNAYTSFPYQTHSFAQLAKVFTHWYVACDSLHESGAGGGAAAEPGTRNRLDAAKAILRGGVLRR